MHASHFVPIDAYMHHAPTTKVEHVAKSSHANCAVGASRRQWLARLATTTITTAGSWLLSSPLGPAHAMDDLVAADQTQRMAFKQRPRAPLSTLLPATEQRMLLKECLALSKDLSVHSNSKDSSQKDAAIQRLENILVNPKQEGGGYNYYTRGLTEKKRTERDLRILAQYQQSQPRKLSGNIVRAAMNIYITNLRYGSDYTVEDAEWKSSYIRQNGGLPDFRKLIQADLDLRILYMNQVQIRVDDAAAEFHATVESNDDEDFEELRHLLRLANDSMDLWFQLIEDVDIAEATNAVEKGVTIKLADSSYMAGFVPLGRD